MTKTRVEINYQTDSSLDDKLDAKEMLIKFKENGYVPDPTWQKQALNNPYLYPAISLYYLCHMTVVEKNEWLNYIKPRRMLTYGFSGKLVAFSKQMIAVMQENDLNLREAFLWKQQDIQGVFYYSMQSTFLQLPYVVNNLIGSYLDITDQLFPKLEASEFDQTAIATFKKMNTKPEQCKAALLNNMPQLKNIHKYLSFFKHQEFEQAILSSRSGSEFVQVLKNRMKTIKNEKDPLKVELSKYLPTI